MSLGGVDTPYGHPQSGKVSAEARLFDFVARHCRTLAIAILTLAAFNLTYRLGLESVEEWDESLYATTAWEMLRSGNLIGTTFDGKLDYYNSKPPLNVWLIGASFALFGVNLVALRVVSVVSAWLTVLVLQLWTRRVFGPTVSLLASLILATSFGFVHLHAGRSGTPDALMTLLIVLTVVALWASQSQPWRLAWLGPLLAGVFMLKGMAVLMPLLIVVIVEALARPSKGRWLPRATAALLAVAPVTVWAVGRWQVDRWEFFDRIVFQNFVALVSTAVEDRTGGHFYYLGVLQRYQTGWLLTAIGAALLARHSWRHNARRIGVMLLERQFLAVLIGAWAVATLGVPTLVQTKLIWYLNPFYPLFAVVVGLLVANVLVRSDRGHGHSRRMVLAGALVLAAVVGSEVRALWRLHKVTNLHTSVQGVLLSKRARYYGTRVYRERPQRGEAFVVRAMLRGTFHLTSGVDNDDSPVPGDLVILEREVRNHRLRQIGSADGHFIYEATD
jgi:4-amino-4-deoxy-L-arabinose transferase-like glycosyltransferase